MIHRHLDVPTDLPPDELPLDALDDILDRGDFDDWQPLADAVRRDPNGRLADNILRLCRAHEMYGTSRLWATYVAQLRGDHERARTNSTLATIRKQRGRSQADVAGLMNISQSDVSKLERRTDVRVSSLRRYVAALGGELRVTAQFPEAPPAELDV